MTDYKLTKIESILTDFALLPEEALAGITDEDLATYEEEHDKFSADLQDDFAVKQQLHTEVRQAIKQLFGSNSKQVKYFDRNMDGAEDILSSHAQRYVGPETISNHVLKAREKHSLAESKISESSVDDFTMNQLDDAMEYLLSHGYKFGVDFAAHNAVDFASSVSRDTMLNWVNENSDDEEGSLIEGYLPPEFLLDSGDACSEFTLDNTEWYASELRRGKIRVMDERYNFVVKFKDGKSVIQLEEGEEY